MTYQSYFGKLEDYCQHKSHTLVKMLEHALFVYHQNQGLGFMRSISSRQIDIALIKALMKGLADSEIELINAIEAYFIGRYTAADIIDVYLKEKLDGSELEAIRELIYKQCSRVKCHQQQLNQHSFSKGLSHNSELEEAIISAINVHKQKLALEHFESLTKDEKNNLMVFLFEFTNLDMRILDPSKMLSDEQIRSMSDEIISGKQAWKDVVGQCDKVFISNFLSNYYLATRGLMPLKGSIKCFETKYDDKLIAMKIVMNMLIKNKYSNPSTLLWIKHYDGLPTEFWDKLQQEMKLDTNAFSYYMEHKNRYLEEQNRKIELKYFGNEENPKHIIIGLHGWLHSAEAWYPLVLQAKAENKDVLVISYDQFGFGHDENRQSNRIDIGKMIIDIELVTRHVRAQYPEAAIHLLGHSMSGAMLGIFANYLEERDLVQSFHALTPAIAANMRNIFDLRKAQYKIDFFETMWFIGNSLSTKVNNQKYSTAIVTNLPAIIELMLYAYRNFLNLLRTVSLPFYIYAGGRDFCVNIYDFQTLLSEVPESERSALMHFNLFSEGYHLAAQSREKEFVNSTTLRDAEKHAYK